MVVVRDPGSAIAEFAPHFPYVNNSCGGGFAEVKALGMAGMKLNHDQAACDCASLPSRRKTEIRWSRRWPV